MTLHKIESSAPFRTLDFSIALTIFVLMLVAAFSFCSAGVTGTFHDDGVYVSTTKALAENRGYKLINFPGEPWQTKYPILYPLVLSVVWRLNPEFPSNIFALQSVSLVSSALFLSLCYLYLIRFNYASRVVAAFSCLICISIPGFDFFGGQVLSEMPFALALLCCFWTLDWYCEREKHTKLSQVVLGLALAIPTTIRMIGAPIPIVALLFLFKRKLPWKIVFASFVAFSTIAIAPILFGICSKTHAPAGRLQSYQDSYIEWGVRLLASCETDIVLKNIQEVLALTTKTTFCGLCQYYQPTIIFLVLFLAIGLIPYVYLVVGVSRQKALPYLLASYLALVIFWPWPPFRFLLPILPYLVIGFFMSIERALSIKWKTMAPFITALLAVAVIATNLSVLIPTIRSTQTSQIPTMSVPRYNLQWSEYVEVLEWIKQNTLPEDTLCSTYDALTFLYTDRKCVRPYELNIASAFYGQKQPIIGTMSDLLANLKQYRVQYLVVTPQPGYAEETLAYKLINEFQISNKELVTPSFVSRDGRFFVLKIDKQLYEKQNE